MTIQKVLKGPSLSTQKRGRKAMASLGRKVNYLASEVDRENVQMVDSEGQSLTTHEATERLGGAAHVYTEVVSDASRLETQALCERHPDMEPEEVMRAHFVEQARLLEEKYYEGEKRILVAVHGEPDGSYHAHLLLPSDRADLRNLDGQHGEARRAWDAAWRKDRKLKGIRDPQKREEARAEQAEFRARIKEIREEKKALDHELREARKGQDVERTHQANRAYAEQAGGLEERRHALEMERIDKFFVARKMTDSLEHKVEQAAELDRHVAAERQAQAAKFGLQRADVERQNRAEREDFKHLNAAQRLKIREAGLERELAVVRDAQAWRLSGMQPGTPEHEAQIERHAKEIEGILLRHEAAKLRDQERELGRFEQPKAGWSDKLREAVGGTRRPTLKKAEQQIQMYPVKRHMLGVRHDLEWRELLASSAGRGKEPTGEALQKLQSRQSEEVKALERRTDLARLSMVRREVAQQIREGREGFKALNAAQRAVIREAGLDRELGVVREIHALRLAGMEAGTPEYAAQAERHRHEIEGMQLRHEVGKIRDHERDLVLSGDRAGTYAQREALMQRRHDLEHRVLSVSAAGRGAEAAPEDVIRLNHRQSDERARLASEPKRMGFNRAQAAVIGKGKAVARGVAKLPGKALQKIQKALKKLHKGHKRGPKIEGAEVLKGTAERVGHSAVAGVAKVATTAAVEAGKAALHQARHAAEATRVTAQAIAVGVINPVAGVKEAGKGYAEVGAKSAQTAGRDLVSGAKNTSRDAATAAKDTAQQGLGSLVSGGLSAAPQEVQALARTMKEAVAASARATRQLVQGVVTLNPLQAIGGTATEVAKGGLAVGKEATKMVAAKLPMPIEKSLDLAAKIPVLGLAAKAAKLSAEVSVGGLTKGLDLGR